MRKTAIFALFLALATTTAAEAQGSGGRHGGGSGGGGNSGGGSSSSGGGGGGVSSARAPLAANQIDVIGVVEAIDTANNRLTVRYDASEPLDLPAGTMPFQVSKPALLKGVTIGEKIRFKIDSHQITEVAPFQLPKTDD